MSVGGWLFFALRGLLGGLARKLLGGVVGGLCVV